MKHYEKIIIILSLLSLTAFAPFFKITPIRSIYIGTNTNFENICEILRKYNANAVVIDVKDDWGHLLPILEITHNEKNQFIKDKDEKIKELLKKLKQKKIYLIARIVAFKEFTRDDLCITDEKGSVWIDKEKTSWMHPNNEKAQQYLEEICTSAIKIGFDEVQLDYIRFSSYLKMEQIEKDQELRIKAINHFIDRICNAVHKINGKVSVCVFGCTIEGSVDTAEKQGQTKPSSVKLGQDYVEIAKRADFICPMIYPSHYPKGTPKGIKEPDLEAYKTIATCLKMSNDMLKNNINNNNQEKLAIVRPYLQAFTASWLRKYQKYGYKQIQEQIQAVYDCGLIQWGLFNMGGKYSTK